MVPAARAAARLRELTGSEPDAVWEAPGRVNLIGEHTDYNGGLALPFAVAQVTAVAARRRPGAGLRAWSAQEGGSRWLRYAEGAAAALAEVGMAVPGADVVVDSDLPVGAGLSSSAALVVAVAGALASLAGVELDGAALAEVGHRAETAHAGVPVGRLDHLAVTHGRPGHATLIDFTASTVLPVPVALGPLVVVDTGVRHDLAAGDYAQRRSECEAAARRLGVATLRHATAEAIDAGLDGVAQRRARHVCREDARVEEAVRRLRAGQGIGDLLDASHRSLRDDFEVSCPELDLVVGAAAEAGASGARLTGGGFGGSVVVVGADPDVLAAVLGGRGGWRPAAIREVRPSGGARRVR